MVLLQFSCSAYCFGLCYTNLKSSVPFYCGNKYNAEDVGMIKSWYVSSVGNTLPSSVPPPPRNHRLTKRRNFIPNGVLTIARWGTKNRKQFIRVEALTTRVLLGLTEVRERDPREAVEIVEIHKM